MIKCTRCGRTRKDKYVIMRKSKYNDKVRPRCRARSVCSTIARRKNAVARREQDSG
jgi:hypothetical protein